MRYYAIKLTNAAGQLSRVYTSFPNNQVDLNALDVELDVPVTTFAEPAGSAYARVWGIPLQDLAQASNLNGMSIQVFGGMQAGLPLANPQQAGLLVAGTVLQAFGNWIGTDQTLDLVIGPAIGTNTKPLNLALNWKAGTPLGPALTQTLQAAFPGYTISSNIASTLVQDHDEVAIYHTVEQLATSVRGLTQALVGGAYAGVEIVLKEKAFTLYDGTSPKMPRQISFLDLIGQPTWLGPQQVSVTCVMRADIFVGDYVQLPKTRMTTTAQALSQTRDASVFQGTFQVFGVRHVGRFRQPDAASWVTVLDLGGSGTSF